MSERPRRPDVVGEILGMEPSAQEATEAQKKPPVEHEGLAMALKVLTCLEWALRGRLCPTCGGPKILGLAAVKKDPDAEAGHRAGCPIAQILDTYGRDHSLINGLAEPGDFEFSWPDEDDGPEEDEVDEDEGEDSPLFI